MKRLFVVIIGMGSTLFGLESQAASLDFVRGGAAGAILDDSSTVSAIVYPTVDGSTSSPASGEGRDVGFLDLVFDCEDMLCNGHSGMPATRELSDPAANSAGASHGIDFSLLGVLTAGVIDRTERGATETAVGDFSIVFADLTDAATGSDPTVHTTITALRATDMSSVPLPPAWWLLLAALLTLAGFNSRKRRGAQPLPSY